MNRLAALLFSFGIPTLLCLCSGSTFADSVSQRLSVPNSSIRFGVTSPSPTLQMTGSFTRFNGTLVVDPSDVTRSRVEMTLDLQSAQLPPDQVLQAVFLQTAVAHLKSPQSRFASDSITRLKGNSYLVAGTYTWQGKSRRAEVPIEVVQLSPGRSEIRIAMAGTAKPGETPPEVANITGSGVDGSRGWAKGQLVFVR